MQSITTANRSLVASTSHPLGCSTGLHAKMGIDAPPGCELLPLRILVRHVNPWMMIVCHRAGVNRRGVTTQSAFEAP
jgi:hypothetical protein